MKKIVLSLSALILCSNVLFAKEKIEKPLDCDESERTINALVGSAMGIIAGPIGVGSMAIALDKLYLEACEPTYQARAMEEQRAIIAKFKAQKEFEKGGIQAAVFDLDSAVIERISKYTLSLYDKNEQIESILIIGHGSKIGTEYHNYQLGLKRAFAMKNLFVKSYGIDESKIGVTSKSFNEAIFEKNEDNQRAEVIVTYKKPVIIVPEKDPRDHIEQTEIISNY